MNGNGFFRVFYVVNNLLGFSCFDWTLSIKCWCDIVEVSKHCWLSLVLLLVSANWIYKKRVLFQREKSIDEFVIESWTVGQWDWSVGCMLNKEIPAVKMAIIVNGTIMWMCVWIIGCWMCATDTFRENGWRCNWTGVQHCQWSMIVWLWFGSSERRITTSA